MYRIWLSVFGTGYSPIASGTCGSAVVTLLFFIAAWLGATGWTLAGITTIIALHGFVVSVLYGDKFIAEYGKDPKQFVSDEQTGQAITYLWIWPFTDNIKQIIVISLIGFILFRLFDIIKPPPVRQLEQIKGAWGVLLDDVMAGVYAAICLQILWHTNTLTSLWS